MMPLKLNLEPSARIAPEHTSAELAFVNHLRFVAMACRSKPRADLFEACALLQVERSASRTAHADALMRCVGQALGKTPRLHAPGTAELSFDETWLLQLGLACARGDVASQAFLLNSRLAHENRSLVRFLIGQIADCFSLIYNNSKKSCHPVPAVYVVNQRQPACPQASPEIHSFK